MSTPRTFLQLHWRRSQDSLNCENTGGLKKQGTPRMSPGCQPRVTAVGQAYWVWSRLCLALLLARAEPAVCLRGERFSDARGEQVQEYRVFRGTLLLFPGNMRLRSDCGRARGRPEGLWRSLCVINDGGVCYSEHPLSSYGSVIL
ncbi:hypothetical protein MHYP_G00126840 [Metynnis hypsauchen]